jgi:hypothetical protein
MSSIGNITNPVILHAGDPVRDVSSAGMNDLAQSTKNTNNVARVTPTQKAGEIQQASRAPRSTPANVAKEVTQESNTAHFTPQEDQVTISENARSARSPAPVQTGETLGGLNVENNVDIKA